MPGNSFGKQFVVSTFGESHGPALGCIVDGCPSGIPIKEEDIQIELDRRRPGQSDYTTPRAEGDKVEILSGVFEGISTGAPIAMLIRNTNVRSQDYDELKNIYRPGHADYTYEMKYGHRDWRGSGRASARETIARTAAGAIAKKLLALHGIEIFAYVTRIGKIDISEIQKDFIEKNPLRCPDPSVLEAMMSAIEQAAAEGDSLGGIVEVQALGVPIGLGEPVFDKLSADFGKALLSLPAVKGFEIGDGFACTSKKGSENNDILISKGAMGIRTFSSNHAGGILGGISNGEPIVMRCALKPVSSISKAQKTIDKSGAELEISVKGRHDPCVCPRAVPIVESMVALVLADHFLRANNK